MTSLLKNSNINYQTDCQDACDTNDDGENNIADVIYILGYLFAGRNPPPQPFIQCGFDSTVDNLNCRFFPTCN